MSSHAAGGCPPPTIQPRQAATNQRKPRLKASFSCVSPSGHGEIVVIEEPSLPHEYVVGWRRDRRCSRSILRLSAYDDRQSAISNALSLSCGYVPSAGRKRNRTRDAARSAVYLWEREFTGPKHLYSSIKEAVADAAVISSHFGVSPVPVALGNSRLASGSYFIPSRGIVLAASMLDRTSLIHEVAHYLVWRMGIVEPAHGPAFTAVLVVLHMLMNTGAAPEAQRLASKYSVPINYPLLDGLLAIPSRNLAA
ncbi:SprT-like domain-containing protein [Rhizobium sp. BK176]|uniref:SprT-like domain-containing protein n=1 Tax=Rhizobium sp. BK176 TaxID=2587071 RepID=UPI0021684821|nr:SprT-like domain-containing protein [Rhizobium sp. BK176]MCS4089667.1 hypothetical protein [Rhizobium sp. BK176]